MADPRPDGKGGTAAHASSPLSGLKAHLGAAERYVKEMRTETDSAFMIVVEVSAAAGVFCISFMQRFATDVYLDTFLDELHQQGLTYEITDRHPLQIAPIADYRNK